jgi:hypothetical protein
MEVVLEEEPDVDHADQSGAKTVVERIVASKIERPREI